MQNVRALKRLSVFNCFKSRKGSLVTTLGIATATLGLALAVGSYVLNTQKVAKVVSSEGGSLLLNNLVLTRVAQAISSTAILCSDTTELCYWNKAASNTAPENFRFLNVEDSASKGEPMKFDVEVCLPNITSSGVELTNCANKIAKAELRIKDIKELLSLDPNASVGVLSGSLDNVGTVQDKDIFGILIKVSSTYLNFDQSQKVAEITGIVRRPRFLVRLETEDSFCAPTCQVSSLGDSESDSSFTGGALKEGNVPKSQSFCFGNQRMINNQSQAYTFNSKDTKDTSALSVFNSTKAVVPVTVWNDGPGYLYNYSLKRSFSPNPLYSYAPGEGLASTSVFFESFGSKEAVGVGPGQSSVTRNDDGLRCFDEKITNTTVKKSYVTIELEAKHVYANVRNHHYDGGAYWKTEYTPFELRSSVTTVDSITPSPSNPKPSGTVTYSFAAVEPSNALSLGVADEDLAGTKTTTEQTQADTYVRYATPIILHNTGMN
jgi:hypothetical protein